MQQAPCRLSQSIRYAFRASKPIHRPQPYRQSRISPRRSQWLRREPIFQIQTRFYSDKNQDVDKKAEEAQSRIDDALNSRVEAAVQPHTKLQDAQEQTIVHTNPEASSIVHTSSTRLDSRPTSDSPPDPSTGALPSHYSSHTSPLRQRFASFMDNFQSHLFTASQRLNDLTGYSGIESLKNQITAQEALVSSTRKAVKDSRSRYADAIATRSTTQREVNDLLQRKHAWTPEDLERFTSLYRSDHANEQTESAAQKEVSDAEARYEEASTTLARKILARYHEEQIWSDKIRQMSTWGTWGLMGLNVLLFVVFQIAIEPWRRRRLVKGFEEKVEVALRERDEMFQNQLMYAGGKVVGPNSDGAMNESGSEVGNPVDAGRKVDGIADHIAEQIVDAVSGSTTTTNTKNLSQEDVEAAADQVTNQEIAAEQATPRAMQAAFASTTAGYAYYESTFRELFSDRKLVVTQKEMTTVALEGALGGAAVMGLLLVMLRPR